MLLNFLLSVLLLFWIAWQFSTIIKYNQFDRFTINTKRKYININGIKYNFNDINFITVNELLQPSFLEKHLTKGGAYASPHEIEYHMNNGLTVKCGMTTKQAVYKVLKQLEPYIKINEDISEYKIKGLPAWLVIVLLILGTFFIVKYLGL